MSNLARIITCKPLRKVKVSDPSSLPPCRAVFEQKLKRSNDVAALWKNAKKAHPLLATGPNGNGWKVDYDKLQLIWFEGPQTPTNLQTTDVYSSTGNDTDSEEIHRAQVKC